eukprot:TRINITY_DN1490_c0_g1_i1.p1 TRINITY_DN1490_c0_g1~~TRINITY_DN1490_c0_g1_i1.p1  ORF type:complete len:231 (-),score=63.29 TRINITY_DN1490_c0_g1_i1:322-1014(-)
MRSPLITSLMRQFSLEIEFSEQQRRRATANSTANVEYGPYTAFLKALRTRVYVRSHVQCMPMSSAQQYLRQVVSECIDLSGAPRAMCLAFVNKHRQELEKALTGQGIRPKLRSDQRSSHNAALLAASTLAVSPDPESERRYSFTAVHSSRFMVNDMCVERGIDTSPRSSYIPCASAAANSTAVLEDAAGSIAEFASRKVDAILASVLADAAKTGAQKQKPPTTQSPPQPA